MKNKQSSKLCLNLILSLVILTTTNGCDSEAGAGDDSNDHSKKQPHLKMHRPKDFASAVKRLNELHQILKSDGELPAPIKIEYVEVIHGEGASAHSHYYPASTYKKPKDGEKHYDPAHGDMKETVKRGFVEIDFRQELIDVSDWLPNLAARTDLNESNWKLVDEASDSLGSILESMKSKKADSAFRKEWRDQSEQVESILKELQTVAKTTVENTP